MLLDIISALLKGYLAVILIWLITLIIVIITLVKRKDMFLPVKIVWGIILFIAPVIGLIFYLIFGLRGKKKLLPKTRYYK